MAIAELWETAKHAIAAYTGLSPATFFTVLALAFAFYHLVSGFFAAPPPPRRIDRDFEPSEPLPPPVQLGEIGEEELAVYDGADPKKPLLVAIKGQIYDVTQSRMFYGPGGPYALFAGKDASRALAKMSFEQQDLTGDISGLGPFELEALQDWEYKFMSKYVKVGTIKKSVPVTDEPSEGTSGITAETTEATPVVHVADAEQSAETKESNHADHVTVAEREADIKEHDAAEHHDLSTENGGAEAFDSETKEVEIKDFPAVESAKE
uniref:Cytochrome b5 domain containing protein n=1 Tax=Lilium formosanum x Lilium longiflorum TaxID=375287 RepID=A0A2H4GW79_9LILI|nr:cytochrome b5 domain containing protein [Lilium formosanum x Lilium longiflorum]